VPAEGVYQPTVGENKIFKDMMESLKNVTSPEHQERIIVMAEKLAEQEMRIREKNHETDTSLKKQHNVRAWYTAISGTVVSVLGVALFFIKKAK
jgi:uncharacterized membrane protein